MRLSKGLILFILLFALFGCKKESSEVRAKKESEKLLSAIASGDALELFPKENFKDKEGTASLLTKLKNNCDLANRKGNYINDYYDIKGSFTLASYIYEFHLNCDDIRFIITYKIVNDKIELYAFSLESIKENNFMITHPENRLWKGN